MERRLRLISVVVAGVLSLFLAAIAGMPASLDSPELTRLEAYFQAGQNEQAARLSRELISNSATDYRTLLEVGQLLLDRHMSRDAHDAFERALQVNPKSASAALGLGQVYLSNGDAQKAQPYFELSARLDSASSKPKFLLGVTLLRLGDEAGGLRQLELAEQLDPHNVELLKFLAVKYYENKRYEQAAALLQRVLLSHPEAGLCILQVEAYHQALKYPKALETAKGCTQKFPDSARLAFSMGVQLQSLGRFAESSTWFQKAAALDPSMAEAEAALGDVEGRLGRFNEAITSLRKALALEPDFTDALLSMAEDYQNLGKLPQAEQTLQQAVRTAPNNARCHLLLSRVYFLEKQYAQSAAEKQFFLKLSQTPAAESASEGSSHN